MFKLSARTKKIAFSLAYVAFIVLAASAGFASEEGAHHVDKGAQMKDFGWRVFDFAVLIAIVVWALKKADVKGSLSGRQAQIEKSLKDAQQARAAAEAKLAEYSGKLDRASKEIDEIRAAIVREGENEKGRIIAEAKKAAEKIIAQAAISAEQEVVKARAELRAEAANLAVQIATGKLTGSIQKADHDRFVGEYLDKVVQIQ
ncbi:MAG: ATP synthase F0 subunit B [Deltaproteobacteria bacterium]|nr:ATP synthase F0 subunit B [Deltaproteobacteria bacterium]